MWKANETRLSLLRVLIVVLLKGKKCSRRHTWRFGLLGFFLSFTLMGILLSFCLMGSRWVA